MVGAGAAGLDAGLSPGGLCSPGLHGSVFWRAPSAVETDRTEKKKKKNHI